MKGQFSKTIRCLFFSLLVLLLGFPLVSFQEVQITDTRTSIISQCPVPYFTPNNGAIPVHATIHFCNQSIFSGSAIYHWDFGDGNNSTEANPSHTYYSTGTYQITLTVNAHGCQASYIGIVDVIGG